MTTQSYRTDSQSQVPAVVMLVGNDTTGGTTVAALPTVSAAGTPGTGLLTVQGSGTGNPIPVIGKAVNFGGAVPVAIVSLATVNAAVVKASAGQLYNLSFGNSNATSWRYIKIFNKSTAPVPGTDTPVMVFAIPPNGKLDISFPVGIACATGIGIAITANGALNDNTAVAAGEVIGTLGYA